MTLSDITEAIVDCEHKTAPEGDGYGYAVGTKAMKSGRLDMASARAVSEQTYVGWTRRMTPKPGDLILAREAPVGDVVRVPESPRLCLGQRTVLIRPDAHKVHPRFLHYWLLGPDAQGVMRAQTGGATVGHLNVADIRNLDVSPMPGDLRHQARAGEVLGAIDDLIENNRRRVEVLEEMARAIYLEWFVKFRYPGNEGVPLVDSVLGPIPKGWVVGAIEDLVSIVKATVDPSNIDPATPAVGLEHIPRRRLSLDEWGSAGEQASRKAVFDRGDVLFGKIRPYFHKVSIAPVDGICSTDAIVIRPHEDHWGQAVVEVSSSAFIAHATATSNGTKMPRADWKVLGNWPVVVPSLRVAQAFTDISRQHFGFAENLAFENRQLVRLRDLLLPKLVTGQIDVSTLDLDALVNDAASLVSTSSTSEA